MIRFVAIVFALLGACQFDVAGIGLQDGGARTVDADGFSPDTAVSMPDADVVPVDAARIVSDACVPGCNGDVREFCSPSPDTETCPLGCDPATAECRTLVPSNGATSAHMAGVTNPLLVPAGVSASISSDDGTVQVDSVIVRPGGEGLKAGINFVKLIGGASVLVVTTMTVEQGGYLRVRGAAPIIIMSDGDIKIEGVVDISAGCENGARGCGGPGGGNGSTSSDTAATGCAPGGNGDGQGGLTPETGGGGGAFGTSGAKGGDANGSNPGGQGGALPGTCAGETLVPLMGGSGGGAGGVGNDGGDSGGGGGALQLTSFAKIEIRGQAGDSKTGIRASGAGGRGGEASDGGGGGGSGGGILLEAPRIHIDQATLAANGGGGGGGGNSPDASFGADGPFSTAQAAGGGGTRAGGSGASVLGGATAGVGGGDDTGGGGGGVGIIRLNVRPAYITLGSNVFSPVHTRGDPQTN